MILILRHLFRSFPLLLALAATTSARAADDYLKLIPSTALAWGVVNHAGEANDKLQKASAIIAPGGVNLLEQIKKESGIVKGLDEKGAVGFFVVPAKSEKETHEGAATEGTATAMFFAVSDEKELLGNFEVVKAGEKIMEVRPKAPDDKPKPKAAGHKTTLDARTLCLCFRNGYAVLAPQRERAAVEAAADAGQGVTADMAGLESWLSENDAVVVGTAAGIKFAAKSIGDELKQSRDGVPEGPQAAALHSLLDFFTAAVDAAPKEFSLASAGIRSDQQGAIRIDGRLRLIAGGQLSRAAAEIPPVTENLIAGMPGGPYAIAGGGVAVPKLADAYWDLMAHCLKGMKSVEGTPAEDTDRVIKDLSEVWRQVRSASFVIKTGQRGDPLWSNIYYSLRVDDSRQVLDLLEKSSRDANKLLRSAKAEMLKSVTVKRLEIAGKPAVQQEINFDLSSLSGPGVNRPLLDELIGVNGKLLSYHVAVDEHTVLVGTNVSQERMAEILEVIKLPKKCLATDADVAVTAAMLPADAQWVAYVNERGYVQLTMRLMAAIFKDNPMMADMLTSLPPFPKCPPFGYAIHATPTELRVVIVAPASLARAYGEYMQDMQKRIMNRAAQPNPTPVP